jgi:hypothetical protein
MAYPVVDEQLAKLAMAGKWKQKPIRLDLGTLLLDNAVICFDKQLYEEMEKDGSKDLLQCEVAWGRKIDMELKKQGITKIDNCLVKLKKKKKWSTVFEIDKENAGVNGGQEDEKKLPATVKEEKVPEKTSDEWVAEKDPVGLPVEVPVEEEEEKEECAHCCEEPCVWISKKDDMILFDECEHADLAQEDMPPNNIRRKKLYRQMTLHMQDGVMQKGIRHELPKCVEFGTRELFPSPTFMGFRSC